MKKIYILLCTLPAFAFGQGIGATQLQVQGASIDQSSVGPGQEIAGAAASNTIIFNEVLYDPSNNALDGDANGDGVYDQEEDSFIEFYNASGADFDMGGYMIYDDTANTTPVYTFPANTIVPNQGVVVVFGGGTITGTFGGAEVLSAGGTMSLNNSGEVIGLKDDQGDWVIVFDSDALSNNPNESYSRDPDVTGNFVQSGDITDGGGVLFTPGLHTDNTTPFNTDVASVNEAVEIGFEMYPNPAAEYINISVDAPEASISIIDIAGNVVELVDASVNTISIGHLQSGIYFFQIEAGEAAKVVRFVKE